MIIRNVRLEDLEAIVAIERKNFSAQEAASQEDMKERILTIPDTFLVAELDGEICGYIEGPVIGQRYLTDDLFHHVVENPKQGGFIAITSLSVAPDFKNQGIGMALLATMKDLAVARKRTGLTLTCHEQLIPYYERNGFIDEGESDSTHGGSTWFNMVWESPVVA
ncbi:Predicted N-acetyltransferase YhbS [Streptococcus equinus]|uniref:Predicted N-acetyltransferase YhbS n=1 Tax=Streptococcus equinus TaxID=1335 RepID=A0A1H0ZCK5_STREI|nr:GNAT family N-acetyltransferase [Streptococcus equinus]SDQ25143.1 Predicted N-acetyltransferase YhbS [Streptococcus equinus]